MVDFLVIGPFNSVSYKNIFPYIKDEIISLGYNRVGGFCDDMITNGIWFTTLYCIKKGLFLKEYEPGKYKEFDHFWAINIDRTEDIPEYDGVMGVPITFLEKWNPEQFEIVDARDYRKDDKFKDMEVQMLSGSGGEMPAVEGKKMYARILIRKKKV